jgi:hypothetical protein
MPISKAALLSFLALTTTPAHQVSFDWLDDVLAESDVTRLSKGHR